MRQNLAIVLCLFSAQAALSQAADAVALTPRRGILLLHNGELIAGTITSAGDRYDINLPDAEIHIKRADVALVCENTLDCYVFKRVGMQQGRVQDHLELAEWCLRNQLLEPAEKELADARAADATHPKINLLAVRLKLAKENPVPHTGDTPDARSLPNDELDRVVRNLPAGSMETFTNTVQPLLLNYCSKSGCHGSQSTNALRLQRIPISRISGRHPTQRNLQAALALVDRAKPENSPLVQTPIRPHGNAKLPIFTDREQSQYKQLVQWVYLVANAKDAGPPPTLEERGAPLLQTVSGPRAAHIDLPPKSEQEKWSDNFPEQSAVGKDVAGGAAQPHPSPRRAVLRAMTPSSDSQEFTPRDPFDPEIFNRRFFGK